MDHRDVAATRRDPAPGPRQEYVDAFNDENYGRYRPAEELRRQRGAHRAPAADAGDVDTREDATGNGRRTAARGGRRRGGRGRALTGAVSAAVVTVLAIVTVAEVVGADDDPDVADRAGPADPGPADPAPGRDAGGASDGDAAGAEEPHGGRPSQQPSRRPSFEELMDTTFPMDPDLTGSGELVPVDGSDPPADPEAATVVRYRVDVEAGLGLDAEFFAEAVHRTLNDPRSWSNDGERSFARVSGGDHDFVVTLASPGTTAEWCDRSGLDVREDNVSCNSSNTERVMINAWRWAQGSETYGDDIHGYRQMLINHEVGHRLGYPHATCPAEGAPAPVMMQQTKFLTTEGVTCTPNPWPHP